MYHRVAKPFKIERFAHRFYAAIQETFPIITHNRIKFIISVSTGLLEVGFYCQKIGKLPVDFVNFVEDASSKGTILVSFGSNADWDYAPDELLSLIVEALNRLSQYRIVFAYNGDKKRIRSIGQHIKITTWAPQVEILQHNKTVVFISHGGQKSVKETICGGVPAVYIPLFAEQAHNGELARKAGFAETLHKKRLSSDLLEKVVKKVAVPKHSYALELSFNFLSTFDSYASFDLLNIKNPSL
ncbi:unnamed protein product [Angiostrongylus costaricensis]|uniref:UDP-glucuronosyltransferase n=1 Tax=Angiostrongylus costaricensis TaxID=334426 RepID=A0A0R3PV83_ANGCS|nr:unnamed protein product [Angiostrongylus costaricensis]